MRKTNGFAGLMSGTLFVAYKMSMNSYKYCVRNPYLFFLLLQATNITTQPEQLQIFLPLVTNNFLTGYQQVVNTSYLFDDERDKTTGFNGIYSMRIRFGIPGFYSKRMDLAGLIRATRKEGPIIISNEMTSVPMLSRMI